MDQTIDILLVDDEPRNLDALEAILTDPSYRLRRANDADRALFLLLEYETAAIVLDIKMPGVSGFELAKIIKGSKRFRQIPIVFLTAHMLEDQDVIAGYGAGAVDYLTKPVNPDILRHKIAVFADLFRKTRALAELNETLEKRVKERTAELERSEAALRLADQQKDEFLAVLAHELRNPLAPLRTGLDTLLQMKAPLSTAQRTLTIMNRQVDHMVRLIDDLLDVSRITRGTLELKKERTDLGALVQATVDNARAQFEQRGHELSAQVSRSMFAMVDATRISQIISNLLHNAAKFTPRGGKVRVELDAEPGHALIRVVDSGQGIPADELERVFQMFTRIERSVPDSNRGLGIGLALARRLTEMHGGKLTAASAGRGQGTTFTLSLVAEEVVDGKVVVELAAPSARPTQATGLHILVIEDNDDNADTLSEWLQTLGHHVDVARNGIAGVALLQRVKPQLVLCDIGLPGMDGIEVCRTVRSLPLDFRPVMVALSGWGMEEDRRRTTEAGFDHHFVKPVALDALHEYLRNVKVGPKA